MLTGVVDELVIAVIMNGRGYMILMRLDHYEVVEQKQLSGRRLDQISSPLRPAVDIRAKLF